jgi:hypothetical protein
LIFGGITLLETISDEAKEADSESHYSHRSLLYRMSEGNDGTKVMERIPVREALLKKVAEYSPSTALSLALATSEPQARYT